MPDYKKMYINLFNSVNEAIEQLYQCDTPGAIVTLMEAQWKAEEQYIESGEE